MGLSHVVTNVLRKPILSCLLEFNIGKVQDMSELATEHKVYCYKILNMYRYKYFALKVFDSASLMGLFALCKHTVSSQKKKLFQIIIILCYCKYFLLILGLVSMH